MLPASCPGQDKRFWKPQDVRDAPCPHCGAAIEFWKDDPRRVCGQCGRTVENPNFDLGCAKWCPYAKQCTGIADVARSEALLPRDRLVAEMKRVFGEDARRIDHALQVLAAAEDILRQEGGDPLVVIAAALLHDIGIPEAGRKHGSAAARYQEIEGPPIARRILESLGVQAPAIGHICRIIASHHSGRDIDTQEFRILWDADWLVNIPQEHPDYDQAKLKELIDRTFRTPAGWAKACRRFLEPAARS